MSIIWQVFFMEFLNQKDLTKYSWQIFVRYIFIIFLAPCFVMFVKNWRFELTLVWLKHQTQKKNLSKKQRFMKEKIISSSWRGSWIDTRILSQPHFWKSVRMTLTLLKWGLGSPSRLSKLQSSIAGVKKPCLEAFFISLENYQSVDVKNGLAWAIWTFVAQIMAKRRARSQTSNLTPNY